MIQGGGTEKLPELWEQIEKLARYYSNRYARAWASRAASEGFDDLSDDYFYSCGYPALCAAVETFDGATGCVFSTCYTYYFQQEVRALRGLHWRVDPDTGEGAHVPKDAIDHTESLNAPIDDDSKKGMKQDLVPDTREPYEDTDRQIYIEQLCTVMEEELRALPPEQEDVLRRRFYQDQTLDAAGRDMGMSCAQARKIEGQALRSMRRPKVTLRLKPFLYSDCDVYAAGLQGGYSTERAAMRMVERKRL